MDFTNGQADKIKKMCAIKNNNCGSCIDIGTDDDGSDYGFLNSWPICYRFENYQNLKSFPFKKDMKCWTPNFWASKFVDFIKNGTDKEENYAARMFCETIETAIMYSDCETRHMWE